MAAPRAPVGGGTQRTMRGGGPDRARRVSVDHAEEGEAACAKGCLDSLNCSRSGRPNNKVPQMVFTGAEQGDYEKVSDHVFVGEGEGSYMKEEIEIHYGWKLRKCTKCCVILCAVLVFAGINCFLFAFSGNSSGEPHKQMSHHSHVPATPAGPATPPEDDCTTNFEEREVVWTAERRDHCCSAENKGCPTGDFDCEDQKEAWLTQWTPAKKDVCCGFSRKRCHKVDSSYDCIDGAASWKLKWTLDKQQFCCKHFGRGCQFECDSKPSSWGEKQRTFCCKELGRGCAPATTATTPAPAAEPPTTTAKKMVKDMCDNIDSLEPNQLHWCCQNQGVGCSKECDNICMASGFATTCTKRIQFSAVHDAPLAAVGGRCKWAHEQVVKECSACADCDVVLSGCQDTDPYACTEDLGNEEKWAAGKLAWCCEHKNEGCHVALNQACQGETSTWTFAHKQWCCDQVQKGCPSEESSATKAGPSAVDCSADDEAQWTFMKAAICCKKAKKGCEVAGDQYDCSKDFDNWREKWSHEQQEFCCAAQDKACETHNCSTDKATWKTSWTLGKKEHCCKKSGVGCLEAKGATVTE